MASRQQRQNDVPATSPALVALGQRLSDELDAFTEVLEEAMVGGIPGLPHDDSVRELLYDSIRANIETAARIYLGELAVEDAAAPRAALDYARHLARREAPPNALARAYRWGHQMTTEWAIAQLAKVIDNLEDERQAYSDLTALTFGYVDRISELVLAEYQAERDRWLAHRSTLRAQTLVRVLEDDHVDVPAAERTLSYRLHQSHLAAVLWLDGPQPMSSESSALEEAATPLATAAGASGRPLFVARDPETAWLWLPWAAGKQPDLDAVRSLMAAKWPRLRAALGEPARALAGFRASHRDALLAEQVARAAGSNAPMLVSAADSGVRAAALLAADLPSTRRMVEATLGGLAADTPAAASLRETLEVFLQERNSHAAAGRRLHIHTNTVAYRVGKAAEVRGRPFDGDWVDLQFALNACRWLGTSVLPLPESTKR